VVDAGSIAASRRSGRAKTDKLDGEALVRTPLAYKRGEPRVCAMVAVPSVEEEDRRRVSREQRSLVAERVRHVHREIERELDCLELVLGQIKEVERERDALLQAKPANGAEQTGHSRLLQPRGIGAEFASVLHSEGFFRTFANRRQVAGCSLCRARAFPWQSGAMGREQGLSKPVTSDCVP
jgi:transposase